MQCLLNRGDSVKVKYNLIHEDKETGARLGKLETNYEAPFDDPSWEIWSMNKHADEQFIPRVDKWFDIHIEPQKKDRKRRNLP